MLFCGIDWCDRALDFHLRTLDGQVLCQGAVKPTVEGLGELLMPSYKPGVSASRNGVLGGRRRVVGGAPGGGESIEALVGRGGCEFRL